MATVVVAEDKVLMVKRISGEWGFVGGNYEPLDQSILGCAERETGEEIRAKLKNFEFKIFQKIYIKERDKTYVTAILTANPVAERIEDVQITLNPREAGSWGWFSWDKLPKPLFPPNQQLIEQGFNPFH
ncbi:MAG: nudix hydrolase 1-like [Bacteriovoracaceae bacterium]|nr:nudix hydrolase 1-like [Bacteriovoracaceae bacterium]